MGAPLYVKTLEGIVAPSQDQIRTWIGELFKEIFGASATTHKTTPNGKLIDFATRIAVTYFEGGAGAANASWFTGATGVALEKILSLFAFSRIPASSSIVSAVVYGADATVIGGGSLVSVADTETVFVLAQGVVLGGGTGYVVVIKAFSSGDDYTVEIAGQPWNFVALNDSGQDIAEGVRDAIIAGGQQVTAVVPPHADPDGNWLIVVEDNGLGPFTLTAYGTGDAQLDAYAAKRTTALAESPGPYEALAGTLTGIKTSVNGWEGVTNTSDATLGANAETDAAYRLRHRAQLLGKGSASVQAIGDALAVLEGVTYVAVRENDTDVVDEEGLPKHSVRVTILGGDDLEIAQTIFKKKAAGIKTYGNTSEFVVDGEGNPKEIFFQRPVLKYVWAEIVITPGEKYPVIGDPEAAIAAAVALWGDANISIADDVERFAFGAPINVVPGVKGATVRLGYTLNELDPEPPVFLADLIIASTELALFDSSRILVTT